MIRNWNLTDREFEVLQLIVEGYTNTQIAKKLFISNHTVKAHVSSIYYKTGIPSRVALAVAAIRSGILQDKTNQV